MRTLGFSGADGSLQLLAPAVLANEFKRHMPQHYEGGGHLECVVLNACNSGGADRGYARLGSSRQLVAAPLPAVTDVTDVTPLPACRPSIPTLAAPLLCGASPLA